MVLSYHAKFVIKCDVISSVSARPEFFGVIDDPLFEILGVIDKFRGSELFLYNFFCLWCVDIKGIWRMSPIVR